MTPKRNNWYAEIAVAILVIVLVFLCVLLVRQYQVTARQEAVSAARVHFSDIARHHPLGAVDAGLIAPWMTFDYVSVSFKVPVSYITATLAIPTSTPEYPNVTLSHYARAVATSSAVITEKMQTAVRDYLAPTGK